MNSVSTKVTNDQSGKNVTNGIPVNGRQQSLAAVYSGSFQNGRVVITTIEVQKPAEANGVLLKVGPPNGPSQTLRGDGTPFQVNGGQPMDCTDWTIAAVKQ